MASAAIPAERPVLVQGKPTAGQVLGFFIMVFGMFISILDIQIVNAALGDIQAGLAASPDEASWIQSSYLIAEIVMIPLSGFLSRALSTRNLVAISAFGFTIASLLCATATSIQEMVIYRSLQGFLGGALIPAVYGATFAIFGRDRQASMTVLVALVVTLAPTIGPTLGGWIAGHMGWRWLFLVNLAPGLLISIGVWALVDIDRPDYKLLRRIDIAGLLSLALFLGGLQYVLEEGARKQWFEDSHILIWAVITTAAGLLFFYRAFTAREPIVRLTPFANYNFAAGALLGGLMGVALYGITFLYPLYLGRVAQLSAVQIGEILSVTGITMVISAPIVGRLSAHMDRRFSSAIGFALLGLSCLPVSYMTNEWRFHELILPQALRGLGIMFCIVSMTTLAFATLRNDQLKDAAGLFTLMRNLGGAVGLASIHTFTQWRYNHHYLQMSESLNPGRPEVQAWVDGLTEHLTGAMGGEQSAAALKLLGRLMDREIYTMSYADSFTVMGWAFLAAAFIPLFLRKPPAASGPGEAH